MNSLFKMTFIIQIKANKKSFKLKLYFPVNKVYFHL